MRKNRSKILYSSLIGIGIVSATTSVCTTALSIPFSSQTIANKQADTKAVTPTANDFIVQNDNSVALPTGYTIDVSQPFISGVNETICVAEFGGEKLLVCLEKDNSVRWSKKVRFVNRIYYNDTATPYIVVLYAPISTTGQLNFESIKVSDGNTVYGENTTGLTEEELPYYDLFKGTGTTSSFSKYLFMSRSSQSDQTTKFSKAKEIEFNENGSKKNANPLTMNDTEYGTKSYSILSMQPCYTTDGNVYAILYASTPTTDADAAPIRLRMFLNDSLLQDIDLTSQFPVGELSTNSVANDQYLKSNFWNYNVIPSKVYERNASGNKDYVKLYGLIPTKDTSAFSIFLKLNDNSIQQKVVPLNDTTNGPDINLNANGSIADGKYYLRTDEAMLSSQAYNHSILVINPTEEIPSNLNASNFSYSGTNSNSNKINVYNQLQTIITENNIQTPISAFRGVISITKTDRTWQINTSYNSYSGGFNYATFVKNNKVLMDGITALYANEYQTTEKLKTIVDAATVKKIFSQYQEGTDYSFTDFDFTDKNLIYGGGLSAKMVLTSGFNNQGNIASYTSPERIIFSGFHKWETTLASIEQPVNAEFAKLMPDQVSDAQLAQYVYENRTTIFRDIPLEIKPSDIQVTAVKDNLTDRTKTFTINLSKYVDSTHRLVSSPVKPFENFKLTGFKEITTSIKSNVMNVPPESTSWPNVDPQITDEWLIQQLDTNKATLFNYLPDGYVFNTTNVQVNKGWVTSNPSEIRFTCTLKNLYNGNSIQNQEFIIKGFKTDGLNTTLSTTQTYFLSNVDTIYAIDINKNKDIVNEQVLKLVKENVQNLPTGVTRNDIKIEDVAFDLVPNSIDNKKGECRIIIHLMNDKAWVGGHKVKDYTFNNSEFKVNGFLGQQPTKQNSGYSVPVTNALRLKMANDFIVSEAEVLINDNLTSIFQNLPEGAKCQNVTLEPNNAQGTCNVSFNLSKYYDEQGLVKTVGSQLYTVKVTGFHSTSTYVKNQNVRLTDASDVYSIDSSIVNASYIQGKLATRVGFEVFGDLREGYSFNGNTTVTNIRNSWIDSTIPFGTVRFDVMLNDVYTETGTASREFHDIEFSGFKTSESTTVLQDNSRVLVGDKSIMNITPGDVTEDNLSSYEGAIKDAIMFANETTNIFRNLIPGTSLSASAFTISQPTNADNLTGTLQLTMTLKKTVCWENGLPKEKSFIINLEGFNKRGATIWKPQAVYGTDLKNIYPSEWTNENATSYVVAHKEQFFTNIPPDFADSDITAKIIRFEDIEGYCRIEVQLTRFYDDKGQPANTPPITHNFTINGFKQINPNPTTARIYGLTDNRNQFWPDNPFTADVLARKEVYANNIKSWVNENRVQHLDMILENYDLNGAVTELMTVEIESNYNTLSVVANLTFNNVSLGSGVNGSKTFSYVINTKPTLNININPKEYTDLSQDALEKLAQGQPGESEAQLTQTFITTMAERIYNAMSEQVYRGDFSIYIKNLVANKPEMMKVIESAITVEYDPANNRINAATFNSGIVSNYFKSVGGISISPINFRVTDNSYAKKSSYLVYIFSVSVAVSVLVIVILIFALIGKQKKLQKGGEKFEELHPVW